MDLKIMLLTKEERFSRLAQAIARQAFGDQVRTFAGRVGDAQPAALRSGGADVLISFLSPWIVARETLDRCPVAINFHPGSSHYPGTGCYNFALYEEAKEYGAVCHHMLPKVDTGRIVLERRFPIRPADTVETLKLATMRTMIGMFREVVALIAAGKPLPEAATHWTRPPFTRRQMESLKLVSPSMPPVEVRRRVRATVYPGYPGPVLRLADGSLIPFQVPERAALA